MSKKQTFVLVAFVICVIAAAGGLLASNMGFKLNYRLDDPGGGATLTGKNTLSLPYFRQTGMNTSADLATDIGSGSIVPVTNIARYNEATDAFLSSTHRMGTPNPAFNLVAGEGYLIQMASDVNYIIVGAHDPAFAAPLNSPGGGSLTGKNFYAPPYNITAANSAQLAADIGGGSIVPVTNVARYNRLTDAFLSSTHRMGTPNPAFNLVPGEAYLIQMASTVPYVASHY